MPEFFEMEMDTILMCQHLIKHIELIEADFDAIFKFKGLGGVMVEMIDNKAIKTAAQPIKDMLNELIEKSKKQLEEKKK